MTDREWQAWAIGQVEADANRTSDTHLHVFPLPPEWGVRLYLKDESVHPTGSLKHRLARSLVLYGLCNNWIRRGTTLVEASSGSTAVSEAYFARLLGLPFVAVMPASTVKEKCDLIEFYGGRCHLVDDPATIYAEADGWRPSAAGTTWTSSPTPSGRPTGAATTTSPSRCSPSCGWSRTRCRTGWWSAPGPGAPAPPSGATCASQAADPAVRGRSGGSAFFPSWTYG